VRKILFAFSLFILLNFNANDVFAKKNKSEEWQINSDLHKLQYCQQDSDCSLFSLKCPFGCNIPLNRNNANLSTSLDRIDKFDSHCKYQCYILDSALQCLNDICVYAPAKNLPSAQIFPDNPDDFTKIINISPQKSKTKYNTDRYIWNINDKFRVRFESLPDGKQAGNAGYNPRHHGKHYHVTKRKDKNISYRKKSNIIKIKPLGYLKGAGTGFIAGEAFPQELMILNNNDNLKHVLDNK